MSTEQDLSRGVTVGTILAGLAPQTTGYLTLGQPDREIRVYFDGNVTISEGITLDEAAREFWAAVRRLGRSENRGA